MSNKVIILVEDDVNLRLSMALILQRAGFIVTAIEYPYKAMDFIQTRKYDLIITDLDNPETRKVLIPEVLGVDPYLSIVILTDQLSLDLEAENKLVNTFYLVKPIAPERLLDCVSKILGKQSNTNYKNNNNLLINKNRDYQ